jgi:hypothetical protein
MPPVTIDGTNGITTPMYSGAISANAVTPSVNMKSRIINGAMVIDQRNAGASVTSSAGGTFSVDRFTNYGSGGGVYTSQQSSDVPTGAGFVNSIVCTVTTTDSPTGLDYYLIQQGVEGYNAADLQWGTASAKTITLSFWVKSSIAGTYTAAVRNSALDRSYRATYTISSANTWEQKSVTIAGDTTGTWLKTNGMGISVGFALGAGASLIDTGNVWSSGQAYAATGQTQWIATNGATFYITGVQLEVGSTATSFDYRPYGTELALCQRYYWKNTGYIYTIHGSGTVLSGTDGDVYVKYPVSMRTSPTMGVSGSSSTAIQVGSTVYPVTSITGVGGTGLDSAFVRCATAGTMTANSGCLFRNDLNANGFFEVSAEL